MEILHGFNLRVGRSQSLCLIGPNGAGKSTVLHSIFGFTNIYSGSIATIARRRAVRRHAAVARTRSCGSAGIAYILQDKSVFPGMTVEENLWMGAYLMDRHGGGQAAPPRRCSTAIRGLRRGASIPPRCCRAASGGCSKSAARW